jgi:quinol monooxygenase YgiN
MIGRIVEFEGSNGAIADLERVLREECVDELKALPGLAGLHVMSDRDKGKAVVLAIWEDTASADGAMSAMVPIRKQILSGGITQSMRDYEVLA